MLTEPTNQQLQTGRVRSVAEMEAHRRERKETRTPAQELLENALGRKHYSYKTKENVDEWLERYLDEYAQKSVEIVRQQRQRAAKYKRMCEAKQVTIKNLKEQLGGTS